MANATSGQLSKIQWDADGAGVGAAVDVTKGSTYEYTEETNTETVGPFFGENEDIVVTGDKYSAKVSATVPEGADAGQDAMQASRAAHTRGTLSMWTVKGKKIVMTNCLLMKLTYKGEAKGSQTLEVEAISTAGAITNAPTS